VIERITVLEMADQYEFMEERAVKIFDVEGDDLSPDSLVVF